MDSFFSLFDPSDGVQKTNKKKPDQDNVKKKTDAPKGRRRGRRCQGKNETLPEESSFLCEPQLSTELLVKDGSYIESYIEIKRDANDTKPGADKRPKRRNSSRKNRRKKKMSPPKDVPNSAWYQDSDVTEPNNNWNNTIPVPKNDVNIGKNVNDLKDIKRNKRKNSIDFEKNDFNGNFDESDVYNVIDKLEKVNLKDDMYLAGDFSAEQLDDDLYSSDDMEESFDDTASDMDDSSDEARGSLPPEPRFGNVEYKLQLVAPCERRFQHLVTQLKWRLRSGGGSAIYVVGVRDCGALVGLRAGALRASLRTLRAMAAALSATVAHVTARRVKPHRAVAEAYIRKLADTQQSVELRVAVLGADEAGKSTLIGVLTQGELDNGRGSARLNMFRHLHEVKSGRTSSLSHEILGFDAQGNVVNYGCSELMTAERIGERSAKLVSFLDLAGHSKYQRTTLHGLTGYCPHYAMLVISATAGVTSITEEHLALVLALDTPLCVVLTKCELAPQAPAAILRRLDALLAAANKRCLLITDENLARNCVGSQRLLDALPAADRHKATVDECPVEAVPVFPVSCVRGAGINALHAYLLALQPPSYAALQRPEDETCEFQIDEIFHVCDSTGPVVGGLLARGRLYEGDDLIIGPLDTGEFFEISVKTIYRNRVPHGSVRAGQSASLGLSMQPPVLRPGMVLLARPAGLQGCEERPTFGGCPPGTCQKVQVTELLQNRLNNENPKNKKNVRRKNKNLLQDIAQVENSLAKNDCIENTNLYKSDSDGEKPLKTLETNKSGVEVNVIGVECMKSGVEMNMVGAETMKSGVDMNMVGVETEPSDSDKCTCSEAVILEDPNNPRGCIYFQASVRVLRHATTIHPGFQCTVHVGNVRQTAVIQGILSVGCELRAGQTASVLFRFARCPEFLVRGRRLLFTAGLGTRAIGRVTQVFPYFP